MIEHNCYDYDEYTDTYSGSNIELGPTEGPFFIEVDEDEIRENMYFDDDLEIVEHHIEAYIKENYDESHCFDPDNCEHGNPGLQINIISIDDEDDDE